MFRSPKEVWSRQPNNVKIDEGSNNESQCDYCPESWDSDTEVEIHRNSAHKKELLQLMHDKKNHVCRICLKVYKDKDELLRHVKSWHLLSSEDAVRVEREIFVCDTCSTMFFNKLLLKMHIQMNHTTIYKRAITTECPKCSKVHRLKAMWYHFQRHCAHSVSCCSICLAKCKNKQDLLAHLEIHKKYLYCTMCRYEGKTEAYYKEHLKTRHKRTVEAGETSDVKLRPFYIPKCGDYRLRFQVNVPLKGLELSFLDEHKIRICVLCREICVGEQRMKEHILYDHREQKVQPASSHMCTCGEVFDYKVLLKHHIFKEKGGHRDAATVTPNDEEEVYTVVLVTEDDIMDME